MKRTWMLLVLGLVGIAEFSNAVAAADNLTVLLAKARADLGAEPKVPVYLPSHLPPEIARYGVKLASAQRTHDGYTVSLYYTDEPSDASFAGMISGSNTTFQHLPNTKLVRLDSGVKASFRQVSCGGSCAPANLWWHVSGHDYSVQLKLPSQMPADAQLSAILVVADSMVLYP
jgi:hypothetical protein